MGDVNKHIIQGHLAADPKVFSNKLGTIVRLTVLTNFRYKESGATEWTTITTRHIVIVRNKFVQAATQFHKGQELRIEGRAHDHGYKDQVTQQQRYERQLVAEDISIPVSDKVPLQQEEQEGDPTGAGEEPEYFDGPQPPPPAPSPSPTSASQHRQTPAPSPSGYGGSSVQSRQGTDTRPQPPQRQGPSPSQHHSQPQREDVFAGMEDSVRRGVSYGQQ